MGKLRRPEYAYLGIDLSKLELHSDGDGRTMVGLASAYEYPMPGDRGETIVMRKNVFKKSLQEQGIDRVQVLYQHGHNEQIGRLPLGKAKVIQEDDHGLWTETPLARTSYNEDIVIPLLADGVLSMSVGFGVIQEQWDRKRDTRYIAEAILGDFGPTPTPRNLGASAALHSLEVVEWLEHWDGAAAMQTCDGAADFRQIAFERANDSDPDTAAHWALPHHPRPGAGPDPQGVAAALAALGGARGGAPDLKESLDTVRSHLQAHQSESSDAGDRSTEQAAASLDPDRLNWLLSANRKLESELGDLDAMAARIAQLKE